MKVKEELAAKKVDREVSRVEEEKKIIERLRAQLPLQRRTANLQLAEMQFGLSKSWAEISEIVRKSIPVKFMHDRICKLYTIEEFAEPIPDKALLAYAEAKGSNLFDSFRIAKPEYVATPRQTQDPWLLGAIHVGTSGDRSLDAFRYIVLAYWD